jgi:uncharacterized tellurite resistance protein B-like protein
MRSYPVNSTLAAARLLALTAICDGNLAPAELQAMAATRLQPHSALDEQQFGEVIQHLCDDLLATAAGTTVQLDAPLLDALLAEIQQPALRRQLLQAMWHIAEADGWLADGEAVLLSRASIVWGAETNFVRPAGERQSVAT